MFAGIDEQSQGSRIPKHVLSDNETQDVGQDISSGRIGLEHCHNKVKTKRGQRSHDDAVVKNWKLKMKVYFLPERAANVLRKSV